MAKAQQERALLREYERLLPLLTAIYEQSGEEEQARLAKLDDAFHTGDRGALMAWARKVVPGAFASSGADVVVEAALPQAPGKEAVDPLPDWWPESPIYHGTRALTSIFTEGLCAPSAERASGDDYGWTQVWATEVWFSWRRDLDASQRRQVQQHVGFPLRSQAALGEGVALFWVTKQPTIAAAHGPVLEVNLAALRYYWWFPDEVLGEDSYVFVLPTSCPQALPTAFREASV